MISLFILGSVSVYLNYDSSVQLLEQTMTELVEIASERVEKELVGYLNISIDTGCLSRLSSSDVSLEAKKELINQRVTMHGFQRGEIINAEGKGLITGNDYSDREYFKSCMNGKPFISEPLISKTTGKYTIIIAAPIWEKGIANSKVYGVVYFVPKETFLNDIISTINVSENSKSYIISSSGNTIADVTMDTIGKQNIEEEAKNDSSLEELAEIHSRMRNGEKGLEHYSSNGDSAILAYAPIAQTNGWSIGINALTSDFMDTTYYSIGIVIVLFIISIIAAVIIAYRLADGISKPVKLCAERLKGLSEGDLKTEVFPVKRNDEIGILAEATASIVVTIRDIIEDIDWGLDEISKGNFKVESRKGDAYVGDFKSISNSMYKIIDRLNKTLVNINQSAEQVSAGAGQVAAGSQALSQGATEQAATVQQLANSINDISDKIKLSAENAEQVNQKADYISEEISVSNKKMQEMLNAMAEISDGSKEIQKIIKTIQDISLQTDILALNATVEAVRAGSAGKGFNVVADEVRILSGKVAGASKDTAKLIEHAIVSVENGSKIANDMVTALSGVVGSVSEIIEAIGNISVTSKEQSVSIEQVATGVDQISSVVQTNSATAEESAATSQQLSGQAQVLKNMVGQFKLKDSNLYYANSSDLVRK